MKIINRSSSTKEIKWSNKDISIDNVSETVLRFKNLVLSQGTSAFDQINKELNTKSPKSYKVKKSEISKSDLLVSNKLKQSILNSAANIKNISENEKTCPILSYGKSKDYNEKQLKSSGKNYIVLRLGSVYGYSTDTARIDIMANFFSNNTHFSNTFISIFI